MEVKDHSRPEEFIRELLQNAFDANRCKLYIDLLADGLPCPDSPTKVEETRRERYRCDGSTHFPWRVDGERPGDLFDVLKE